MPALYAHLRFGEEVAKTLPTPYTEMIARFPEAFALGTQGPDILFYHKPMKANETRKRGTFLHTFSGNKFFLAQGKKLLESLPSNGAEQGGVEEIFTANGAFAAYICGFLCHFTLDTICHPYIDEQSCEAVTHGKIESEFDKAVLRKDGMPIRGYNTATPILDRNGTKEAVAKALDVEESAVSLAIKTMRKINKMFSKKCEAFHGIAHTFLKMAKMERKFGDMFLHKKDDPLCVETNAVLLEKFRMAIPQATALVQEYFQNLHVWVEKNQSENELFRYDFSGIIKTEE